ncbi:DNA polymerase I [Zhongshania aliphaticivorans]|uniref:DNA polymerase I n=1 Tax=Zhongshania aliphaticivorans TaxID=1470434 RepID=A0A5S9PLE2_9GAMM|nr:DNA polymerase I [Zhongshania aliphaticivorans]CAA0104888.1 DNA polymerase I [Zhongshania aliphaticivorans]CAA0105193.1 DNA polymerase I [Zhongshania aliphaticivorans]
MTAIKPLVLVDGSSYLYRAFHALPPLNTSKGQPTGAIKGVINMLRRLQKDYPDSPIAVVFDAKGKTFRDDMYPQYKAQRPPMPDDLRSQIEPINAIVDAMGLPRLVIEGVEADDVIGTLAAQASGERPVLVSTGDKDMAQLVNEHVTLVNTMTDTVMDVAGVNTKFGIPPELIIDFLALMGDKVDNIPGVAGVGEKTALALLQALGGLEDIYQNLDKVPDLAMRGAKGVAKKLTDQREQAFLSYTLATIKCDVPLDVSVPELLPNSPDKTRLLSLFTEFEFKTWVQELSRDERTELINESKASDVPSDDALDAVPAFTGTPDYQLILTQSQFTHWLDKLNNAPLFAFDTETTSLNYMQARVVGVSFAVNMGEAAYLPFGHDYLDAPDQLAENDVLAALKPILEDHNKLKLGQNLKYDANVLANHGITLRGIAEDTMLESYVLDSVGSRHDMDTLALKYLDRSTIHFEDIAGKGAKQLTFNQIALEEAAPYAAEDADVTLCLHHVMAAKLKASPSLMSVYRDIELPLVSVLSRIERNGALVSRELLGSQSHELGLKMQALEKEAYDLAGGEFNLASPKQLGEILFERLNIPVIKKTPKGAPSTAEEVLVELAHDYPLPKVILEHRGMAKLKSTYTDKLPLLIDPKTGRIHTSYHQAVAATGRLSSSDPNLQNIPIRSAEGRRIRQAFIAPSGYVILAADYSQIELRIMAHLSEDQGLIDAFARGEDIHRATAAEVFGVAVDEVSDEQRRNAKAINFGLIYGMSAFGLARQLHIGRKEAQEYIDLYFERYPGVLRYMDETRVLAAEKGFVETLFGRRLYLPEINASNGMRRQAAERTAINAPMQGTAADIIKRAMISVDQYLSDSGIDAKLIMQVHDELVLEVAPAALDEVKAELSKLMMAAAKLAVPLEVGMGTGANWDEAH